jgi:hypothetical protein
MKRQELIDLIVGMAETDVMDLEEVDQNNDGVLIRCDDGAVFQINVKSLRRGEAEPTDDDDEEEDGESDLEDE